MVENTSFTKEKMDEKVGNAVFAAIQSSIPPFVQELLGPDFMKNLQDALGKNGGQFIDAFTGGEREMLADVPDRNATGSNAVGAPTVQDQRTPDQIAQNAGGQVV